MANAGAVLAAANATKASAIEAKRFFSFEDITPNLGSSGRSFFATPPPTIRRESVYASEHARFALTEVTLGIMPGAGGTQTLARAAGERRAKEIILTGKPFTAAEALQWRIVNRVLPSSEVVPEALTTADTIARNAPISVRQAKQAIGRGLNMSLWDGLAFEIEAYHRTVPTEDRREGIASFNEKRPPNFKGK